MGAWDFLEKKKEKPFNVLVALCVHRGVDAEAFDSLFILSQCQNPRFLVRVKSGDALIDRSRSIVASRFLENENYDVLFFIDDDILFNPLDVLRISKLCQEQNLGIVGGAYVKKQAEQTHYAVKTFDGYEYTFGEGGACEEVEHVSTGFMAIQKRVFKEMVDKLNKPIFLCDRIEKPDGTFDYIPRMEGNEMPYCEHGGLNFYPFFQPYPAKNASNTNVYLSEDWAFCDRWKRLGGKIYCDTTTRLGHAGRYVYRDTDMLRPPRPDFKSFKYFDDGGKLNIQGVEQAVKVA